MRLAELSMRLKTLCRYYALLGRVQTTSLTSGFDFSKNALPVSLGLTDIVKIRYTDKTDEKFNL